MSLAVPAKSDRGLADLALLLAATFFWLINRNYEGIQHDARVYSLLVARWIDPPAFARDLFFMFGSQDDYSVFTPLFGLLTEILGLAEAARAIVLIGGALWIAAAYAIGRAAFGHSPAARFACLYLTIATFSYSPNAATFMLNENFATARSLAFPIGMMALAAAFAGHRRTAVLCGLAATLLHPLLGIWLLILMLVVALREVWSAAAIFVGIAMVFVVGENSGLPALRVMDAEWAEVVAVSSRDVFVGAWGTMRLEPILFVIMSLWLGGRWGAESRRRWYLGCGLIAAWAVLVSQWCSYFMPVELVLKAQPWRVLWLANVMAVVAWIDCSARAIDADRRNWWIVGWVGAVLASGIHIGVVLVAVMIAASFVPVACSAALRLRDWLDLHRRTGLLVAAATATLVLPGYLVDLAVRGDGLATSLFRDLPALRGFVLGGGEGLAFLLLALALGSILGRFAVLVASAVLVPYAYANWDTRLATARVAEARYLVPTSVRTTAAFEVPVGDVVAWPQQVERLLFEMRRASYATGFQGIGIVFSADKTRESLRRLRRLALAGRLDKATPAVTLALIENELRMATNSAENIHKYHPLPPTPRGLHYLCADPALDWVVVSTTTPESYPRPVATLSSGRSSDLLFGCARLRAGS